MQHVARPSVLFLLGLRRSYPCIIDGHSLHPALKVLPVACKYHVTLRNCLKYLVLPDIQASLFSHFVGRTYLPGSATIKMKKVYSYRMYF